MRQPRPRRSPIHDDDAQAEMRTRVPLSASTTALPTLASAPSHTHLAASLSASTPHLLASASHDPAALKPPIYLLTPDHVARIAYFPPATASPQRGMNTDIRFVRPGSGRPATALSLDLLAPILPPPIQPDPHTPLSELTPTNLSMQFVFPPSRDLRTARGEDTSGVLGKLRTRTKRLGLNFRLLHPRPKARTAQTDHEQAWQDEQHRAHLCWRCRKAGGRRKDCRAFRRPGYSEGLAAEMYS
ncbi:hypothetical protein WOLCODRAFT_157435 [Wolfiporia cocos MD-104 SS10]|uniref:Uncharacterized protein n=1 Tax=Wolfiporia cocos (strain MD-104) TaxID=742152 RepID=A0A2H3J3A2_WOLCO|nr:hypothetical protein WOLCODRAFT_157435 [Wolfiporia cocos MD-104 SS10]